MKLKLLLYLSVLLVLLPSILAIGDTFSIVQGSLESADEIYFEIFFNDEYLFDSFEVSALDGFYALSITIPSVYSSVNLVPVVDGVKLDSSYQVKPGDTITIDIFPIKVDVLDLEEEILPGDEVFEKKLSSSSSMGGNSFTFQPKENEEKIIDISKGNYEDYVDEIDIVPIPSIIVEENPSSIDSFKEIPKDSSDFKTIPSNSQNTVLEKTNSFFLHPIVLLSLGFIACLLIVLVVLKGKRSEYL